MPLDPIAIASSILAAGFAAAATGLDPAVRQGDDAFFAAAAAAQAGCSSSARPSG